jgi:amidase
MDRRQFLVHASVAAAIAPSFVAAAPRGVDPTELSIAELQSALIRGATTSAKLVDAYLDRIQKYDHAGPAFHSVLAINPNARRIATALDDERARGKVRGPLHGIPILIKDNIETADPLPTTAGSLALKHSTHTTDAPVVAKLRAAGAIILGKSNLSEWANFRSTRSCSGWSGVGGQTGNAYDVKRNPSGSSAGSGTATALSFCAAALGSETDGSILAPSAYNGLVGLKPTVGVVRGEGIVPISPRQDTAGPMGRTVMDVALIAQVMAERPLGFGAYGTDVEHFSLTNVRIGVMEHDRMHPEARACYTRALATFRQAGATLIELAHPKALSEMGDSEEVALLYEFKAAINRYLATQDPQKVPCRTLADLIAFNQDHADQELAIFGQELFEMAQACGELSDEKYQHALATLKRCADDQGLRELLSGVDVLLAPGNGPAEVTDPVWGDRGGEGNWPAIASAAAIAGYPSITVPAGLASGLPVGIILVGARHHDGLLLQVARAFERHSKARIPPTLPQ